MSVSLFNHLIAANISSLQSADALLNQLPDEAFSHISRPYFESSIGKHLRHILDHYSAFLTGLTTLSINYDYRERDIRLESDRLHARQAVKNCMTAFNALNSNFNAETTVKVRLCSDVSMPEGDVSDSTLGRELQFLQSHTVHHYALIAAILKIEGFKWDGERFGVAPSTQVYERFTRVG